MRVIALHGELDIYNVEYVRAQLALADRTTVIDLSGVRLLSAAALTELHRAAKRAGYGNITLVAARTHIREVLRTVHFERICRIADALHDHAE